MNPHFKFDKNNTEGHHTTAFYVDGTELKKNNKIVATDLPDLYDVEITNPQNDDVLTYKNGIWKNLPFTGGGIGCDYVSDNPTHDILEDAGNHELLDLILYFNTHCTKIKENYFIKIVVNGIDNTPITESNRKYKFNNIDGHNIYLNEHLKPEININVLNSSGSILTRWDSSSISDTLQAPSIYHKGIIYDFSGQNGSYRKVKKYNLIYNSFSYVNSSGYAQVNNYSFGLNIYNNKIILSGGHHTSGTNIYLNNVDIFNLDDESFSGYYPITLNNRKAYHKSEIIGNFLYLIGGITGIPASPTNYDGISKFDLNGSGGETDYILSNIPSVQGHATTQYNNEIYVAGGVDKNNPSLLVDNFYKFDPSTGIRIDLTPIPIKIKEHNIICCNGIIYLSGGINEWGTYNESLYAYDILKNAWYVINTDFQMSMNRHGNIIVGNKIYFTNGNNLYKYKTKVIPYNFKEGEGQGLANNNTFLTVNNNHSLNSYNSTYEFNDGVSIDENYILNNDITLSENTFWCISNTYNKYIYILYLNHSSFNNRFFRLNPFNGDINNLSPMPTNNNVWGSSIIFYNKKFYVFGGADQSNNHNNDLYVYDIENDSWSLVPISGTKPQPRNSHFCVVNGNKMYIGGGNNGSSNQYYDIWEFNLDTNVWTYLTTCPNTDEYIKPYAFFYDNKIYITRSVYYYTYIFYDIVNDSWEFNSNIYNNGYKASIINNSDLFLEYPLSYNTVSFYYIDMKTKKTILSISKNISNNSISNLYVINDIVFGVYRTSNNILKLIKFHYKTSGVSEDDVTDLNTTNLILRTEYDLAPLYISDNAFFSLENKDYYNYHKRSFKSQGYHRYRDHNIEEVAVIQRNGIVIENNSYMELKGFHDNITVTNGSVLKIKDPSAYFHKIYVKNNSKVMIEECDGKHFFIDNIETDSTSEVIIR